MMSNNGEWFVTVVDASVIKGFDLFTKSDLYVQLKAGGQVFKTKPVRNSDYPKWNETFSFPTNNYASDIEIKVLDDDFFKDDKIAVAYIPFKQFPNNFGEEKEYSIPLSYNNKDIGILHLRMKNNSNGNVQSNHNNTYATQSNMVQGNNYPQVNSSQGNYPQGNNYPNTANSGGYNSTVLGGHSYGQPNNNLNNLNNLNTLNHNDSRMITEQYVATHPIRLSDPTYDTSLNTQSQSQFQPQPQSTMQQQNYTQNNTHVDRNDIAIVEPPLTTTTALNESNQTYKTTSKDKSKKIHKHKHHTDAKLVLPEKHHHYQDGYTSSSSESSNEGEKRRAREGTLGKDAYAPPLQNNEPYINNTVPETHPNHYYPADKPLDNNTNNTGTLPATGTYNTYNHNNNNNNVHDYNDPNYNSTTSAYNTSHH